MGRETRQEQDSLGTGLVPAEALYGLHTQRAVANFPLSGRNVHPELIKAYGVVKLACARVNRGLGVWPEKRKADAIEAACGEMAAGLLSEWVVVDALQGGAGTSTNMNVNEVIANRALELLNEAKGSYSIVSPLDDINLHQSTNDTYPTALRIAAIRLLHQLEERLVRLQEAFQTKEREFAGVVKVGRTELQDAVLITLGREMSAYAEACARDRWRMYKCEERLRVVNLGGTAVGTGLGAPREYIFKVVDELRLAANLGLARAENLVDATQNCDLLVEVSGILRALASSLLKISGDLRLLSSGPEAGLGEIALPPLQAGSSIMPGKVNPVVPEAVSQVALLVLGYDQVIAHAAGLGNLELNQFMPLIAQTLLEELSLLSNACEIFAEKCVLGLSANTAACERSVASATATASALLPKLDYSRIAELISFAKEEGITLQKAAEKLELLSAEEFNQLVSAEAVNRLGFPWRERRGR